VSPTAHPEVLSTMIVVAPAANGAVSLAAVVAGGFPISLIVPTFAMTLFPTAMSLAMMNYVLVVLIPRSSMLRLFVYAESVVDPSATIVP